MLATAKARDFEPSWVAFDRWYASLADPKAVRAHDWTYLTQLKPNREVGLGRQGSRAVAEVAIADGGTVAHRQGFGPVWVLKVASRGGDIGHWATNDLGMKGLARLTYAERAWAIENYHRGLEQCCGAGRSQVRAGQAQRNHHIGLAIRAPPRLERRFYATGRSWCEAKARSYRPAVRAYNARTSA